MCIATAPCCQPICSDNLKRALVQGSNHERMVHVDKLLEAWNVQECLDVIPVERIVG